jgi:hypothetical protein
MYELLQGNISIKFIDPYTLVKAVLGKTRVLFETFQFERYSHLYFL